VKTACKGLVGKDPFSCLAGAEPDWVSFVGDLISSLAVPMCSHISCFGRRLNTSCHRTASTVECDFVLSRDPMPTTLLGRALLKHISVPCIQSSASTEGTMIRRATTCAGRR
jgi:hypothetical protein